MESRWVMDSEKEGVMWLEKRKLIKVADCALQVHWRARNALANHIIKKLNHQSVYHANGVM